MAVNNPIKDITSTPAVTSDTPEFFEDTNFESGDSPAVIDINTALGRNATNTTIICDGPGEITYQPSNDGISYGDAITLKNGEFEILEDISIDSIQINYVTADSAYRVIAI